jgi:hypothetical protein
MFQRGALRCAPVTENVPTVRLREAKVDDRPGAPEVRVENG